MVLALLAWAAMSLTRLVHGLGFGVEVGAAAPEIFARVLALVARAIETSTWLVRDLGAGVDVGATASGTDVGGRVSYIIT